LGHVETFARYFVEGEKVPPLEFIKGQLLSASMARGAAGVTTFIYSSLLDRGNDAIGCLESAMNWFKMTTRFRRQLSQIGIYAPLDAPYWPTVLSPFLRKIRRLGLDMSVVQLPLLGGEKWRKFIEEHVKVLVLPDPPELTQLEAKFLSGYVERGNSIVVMGYPPKALRPILGIESRNVGKYGGIKLLKPIADRMPIDIVKRFGFELVFCATPIEAEPLAVYESIPAGFQPGAYAVTRTKRNEGYAFFIGIPSLAVLEKVPELLLDVVDLTISRADLRIPWEIEGLTEDCDLIAGEDFVMAVNLSDNTIEAIARCRGDVPRSIQPLGEGLEIINSRDKIVLKLVLKPFEAVGARLIPKVD